MTLIYRKGKDENDQIPFNLSFELKVVVRLGKWVLEHDFGEGCGLNYAPHKMQASRHEDMFLGRNIMRFYRLDCVFNRRQLVDPIFREFGVYVGPSQGQFMLHLEVGCPRV
jgi:hypothetical protein